jgi:hypothetical protein
MESNRINQGHKCHSDTMRPVDGLEIEDSKTKIGAFHGPRSPNPPSGMAQAWQVVRWTRLHDYPRCVIP